MNSYAEVAQLVIALLTIFGAWTATVALVTVWLAGRFRHIEALIYKVLNKTKEEIGDDLDSIKTRVHRLEIKVFGFIPVEVPPRMNEARFDDQ